MFDNMIQTRQGRNRVVDICGLICLLGYTVLSWYSHGTLRPPELPGFFLLLVWVSLPLLVVFACFRHQPASLPIGRLVFWAVMFRCCGLFGMPLFEDDWFRYLWDGYRFAKTGTPYGWAPADSFTDPGIPVVFQRILDRVNYPDLPTIYGPTSQFAFVLAYFLKAGSLVPLQLIFIGFDLLLIRLLLSVAPAGYVLLYAWCPLVVKEIAFTAHPDGMGACLLVAAVLLRRREQLSGAAACLALAVGAKMLAVLLVPFILVRTGLRTWLTFGAILALLYLPFLLQGSSDATSLAVFARAWEFNAALYAVLTQWLADTDAKLLLGACLLGIRRRLLVALPPGNAGRGPPGRLDLRAVPVRGAGDQPLVCALAIAVCRHIPQLVGMGCLLGAVPFLYHRAQPGRLRPGTVCPSRVGTPARVRPDPHSPVRGYMAPLPETTVTTVIYLAVFP